MVISKIIGWAVIAGVQIYGGKIPGGSTAAIYTRSLMSPGKTYRVRFDADVNSGSCFF